ncbi:MAG: GntR family transcriptional regulator [Gammaproteobacteria bacterium]|nr:MAG: GntR family transcriptional regulator [Gammaproteobacteria bacterium]
MVLSSLSPDTGKLILRLCVGGLMLFHGVAKIMHPASLDFISGMLTANNLPTFLAYAVYIGEVLAPLMVIVGYQARTGGLLIAVNMLFALFLAHTGDFFSLSEHGGSAVELQLFYLLSATAVVFLGSGKLAFRQD